MCLCVCVSGIEGFGNKEEKDMALAPIDSTVVINGETFDLVCIPAAESTMVQEAKRKFLGSLDLQSLVDDLGKLGQFMRVAYNGVAGNTEVQIKVQRIGYKITKLADKSAITVHQFKGASQSVLEELKSIYQYLLDGLEEMALETLSMLTDVAEVMVNAADELSSDFDEATGDVIKALEDTQTEKDKQEKAKQTREKERREFEFKMGQTEEMKRSALKAEEQAKSLYDAAQAREDKAQDIHDSMMRSIVDALTGTLISITSSTGLALASKFEKAAEKLEKIGDKSGYKEAIKRANEEKIKHFEEMKKERETRQNAIQQCIEFTQRIINCENDKELADAAIDALHSSVGALKSLSATMMKAAKFWRQMQHCCKTLPRGDMQRKVKMAMQKPKEERLEIWTSTPFKQDALQYYSTWVALDDVCGVYTVVQIEDTSKDLYKYLKENPTTEEAKKNVRQLAAEFAKDLKQAQENESLKEETLLELENSDEHKRV